MCKTVERVSRERDEVLEALAREKRDWAEGERIHEDFKRSTLERVKELEQETLARIKELEYERDCLLQRVEMFKKELRDTRHEMSGSEPAANPLTVKVVCPEGCIPKYAFDGDSGADLRALGTHRISARSRMIIDTGVRVQPPPGFAFSIRPRSGLASKGIIAATGTIDQSYRGTLKVTLYNHNITPYSVNDGDRIAQLVLEPVYTAKFALVEELDDTERGDGGHGSTGIA